jgi:serine/threonine protein phosphatase 1
MKKDTSQFKRIWVIGDIHAEYKLIVTLIQKAIEFNPATDLLIFVGDYIDRGIKPIETITFLKNLRLQYPNNVILLKGNHEQMAYDFFKYRTPEDILTWFGNGGKITFNSFENEKECKDFLIPFIETLPTHFEGDDFIVVHGGIPLFKSLSQCTSDELLWTRTDAILYDGDKKLIVGHTPHDSVTEYPKFTVVDTMAFSSGLLSAYEVNSGEVVGAESQTKKYEDEANKSLNIKQQAELEANLTKNNEWDMEKFDWGDGKGLGV